MTCHNVNPVLGGEKLFNAMPESVARGKLYALSWKEERLSVRTKVRWVKINIILIRLGVINPRRERIPCQIRNPRFASPGCRLHRHLGHTRRSSFLQRRAARGEILSAGGRGRQVPNSCSLESSASRVVQRSWISSLFIPELDINVDALRGRMAGLREQRSIGSSPPHRDMMIQSNF